MKKIFLLFLLLTLPLTADTGVKISQLPLLSASSVGSSDSFPFVSVGNNETARMTIASLLSVPALSTALTTAINANFPSCSNGQVLEWASGSFSSCLTVSAGGTGTVTSVGLATDSSSSSILSVAGSPITTSGSFTLSLSAQNANIHLAGPSSGIAAAPTFRSLVGADLPLPAVATLGGVFSKASVSHNFLTAISSADGSVSQAQPAFTDISGSVAASQLPNPTASTLGGIESYASVSNQWINSISTSGVPTSTQPGFSNLSGSVSAAQLPNPSSSTLGGIQSAAAVTNQWINSISTAGVPALSQPAFSNLSGSVAASQLPNPTASTLGGIESYASVSNQWINAISTLGVPSSTQPAFSNISGTVAAAQLPNPSASTLGGIQSYAAVTNQWIRSISTSGVPASSQPAFTDVSGSVASTQMPALTGDVTTSAGTVATTVAKIQSVTVSGTTGTGNVVFSAAPTFSGVVSGIIEAITGFIETLGNKAYTVDQSAAYAYTINSIIITTLSGTATLAVQIGGSSVTGCSAVSISSTPATGTCTAANSVAIGNKVTLLFSSNSTALDVGFTMKVTR